MAYTTLNDGASHTYSSAGSGPFGVAKSGGGAATSLTIASGATVTGTVFAGTVGDCLKSPGVASNSCNLTITGGTVTGGGTSGATDPPPVWCGYGVLSFADAVAVSGGTVTGGSSDQTGYDGFRVVSPASASIAGVTATGGAGTGADGAGGNGLSVELVQTTDSLTVTSGTYAGGNGVSNGGHALRASISGTLTVTNGTYSGGNGTAVSGAVGGDGASVTLTESSATFVSNGGHYTPGTGSLSSGRALTVVAFGTSSATFNGGQISGHVGLWLDTGATFTVTGSGLTYSGGAVSGTIGGIPFSGFTVDDLTSGSPGFTVTGGGGGSSVTFTGN